jgi:hypothetical protein
VFGFLVQQEAQAQGVYFHPEDQWLIVYTGDSGHDVFIGAVGGFGWVVVQIDEVTYPVYFEEEILTADEVFKITVDTGDGDDTVDLSLVNDTDFPNLGVGASSPYIDIFLEDGDDYCEGPSTDEPVDIYGGDGEDTVVENGSDYLYPDDPGDVENKI